MRLVSRFERYGFALVMVGAALLYKLLLAPALDQPSPFLLFSAAVTLSAWWGGVGPGVLAAALSLAAADYFFMEPRFAFGIAEAGQAVRLAVFGVEELVLAGVAGHGYRAVRAAKDPQRAREVQDLRGSAERLRRVLDDG